MTNPMPDPAPPPRRGREPGSWYAGPVPGGHAERGFVLARLTQAHAERDHAALRASAEYLRTWSDSPWPEDGFSVAENAAELRWHDEEHEARVAFTYSVLDAQERRVRGCIYVRPLGDMLRTRGVEPPEGPIWPGGAAPCARGWIRRDDPETDVDLLRVVLAWLTGPAWALSELWWTAASDDARQLAALDALGWSRELRVPAAGAGREWVLRASPEGRGSRLPTPSAGEEARDAAPAGTATVTIKVESPAGRVVKSLAFELGEQAARWPAESEG